MDILEMIVYLVILGLGIVPLGYLMQMYRKKNVTFEGNSDIKNTGRHGEDKADNNSAYNIQKKQQTTAKSSTKHQKQQHRASVNKRTDKMYNHSWLLTSLKGHTDQVYDIDFSSNGKFLATCSEDRSLLLWTTSNIGDTQTRKSLRVNVEYDHAEKIAWSPDSKALLIHKSLENCIEVIKIEKKDGFLANPSKGVTFPQAHESDVIVGFGISCTGRFIMSCSNKTDIVLWDLKGRTIDKLDTCLMSNYSAKISTCGRFIAACGFSPDVKVWEVKFNKTGEYIKTANVFNLSGHTSGVYDMAFDQDTSHIATVSKDGSWKLFDTKIEYDQGQSPRCLITAKYTPSSTPALIALSPNADVVAIAIGSSVEIFSAMKGTRDNFIENIYNGPITTLMFDPLCKYFLTAGDRHVRVFHNVTGYKLATESAKMKLKHNLTSATRERLEKLIEENELLLKNF